MQVASYHATRSFGRVLQSVLTTLSLASNKLHFIGAGHSLQANSSKEAVIRTAAPVMERSEFETNEERQAREVRVKQIEARLGKKKITKKNTEEIRRQHWERYDNLERQPSEETPALPVSPRSSSSSSRIGAGEEAATARSEEAQEGREYKCPVCSAKFRREESVGIHVDREHSNGDGSRTSRLLMEGPAKVKHKLKEHQDERKKENWQKYADMDAQEQALTQLSLQRQYSGNKKINTDGSSENKSDDDEENGLEEEEEEEAEDGDGEEQEPGSEFPGMLGAGGQRQTGKRRSEEAYKTSEEDAERRVRAALSSLRDPTLNSDGERVSAALKLLQKVIGNILKSPAEDKFRRLKLGNAALRDKLFSLHGATQLMMLTGFTHTLLRKEEDSKGSSSSSGDSKEEEYLVFPMDKDTRLLAVLASLLSQ